MGKRPYRMTKRGKAEEYIKKNANNWMMAIDIVDMTGLSSEVVNFAIKRLQYLNILEVSKEGRYRKFKLKESYINRRDLELNS